MPFTIALLCFLILALSSPVLSHWPGSNAVCLVKFVNVKLTLHIVVSPSLAERGHPCKSHT